MAFFEFADDDILGRVVSVDTATVIVEVEKLDILQRMQVNRLVSLASDPGLYLVGLVQKITRKAISNASDTSDIDSDDVELIEEQNLVRVGLIGTLFDQIGSQRSVFRRTLESVPRIGACCYPIERSRLTAFMRLVAAVADEDNINSLSIGHYTLDENAEAFLDGDRFFQRHAIIVGSTGSGKSFTTARLLEQMANLPNPNAIVFDIHGEYRTLEDSAFAHFRIAGPTDLDNENNMEDGVIFLPHWLLSFDALVPMFTDRSGENAPNQATMVSEAIRTAKRSFLLEEGHNDLLENFTIDSPIPFGIIGILEFLRNADVEMVPGAGAKDIKGPYNGKLTRLVARLENKIEDRRLGFLFQGNEEVQSFDYLNELAKRLIEGGKSQQGQQGGIKILDFSSVPSDVLPLVISLVARMVFSIQQWTDTADRHPIALFCDEAHNYLPDRTNADPTAEVSIRIFEKIAKEGRKFGVGLVVISQRPSEVNRTVLSQCNNMVAMRLTNADDQNRIRSLLPDSLGGFGDLLPILDVGEALVVGDASFLPSRIKVTMPTSKPDSKTVPFWTRWASQTAVQGTTAAVANWRRQGLIADSDQATRR